MLLKTSHLVSEFTEERGKMMIKYFNESRTFLINTQNSTYAFCVNDDNTVTNLHWGARVDYDIDMPKAEEIRETCEWNDSPHVKRGEFCAWGGRFYQEPCLKVTFSGGVRDCMLIYDSHKISESADELVITLKDKVYPLYVDLFYKIYDGLDLIDKHSVIRNCGEESFTVESAMSGGMYLPWSDDYMLTVMGSAWAREYDIRREKMSYGRTVLDSRTLYSNSSNFPYFAIDKGDATEEIGEIWFGTLQWCGNYKMTIEKLRNNPVKICGGLNDFDFAYPLKKGESLDTPIFTIGYTKNGFGATSRMFHDLQKKYIAPRNYAYEPLPVVYNAWGAFEFKIDAEKVMGLIDKAAYIGAELFLIDDGWFGTRDDETSGLGDWYPNKEKFPDGLTPIIKKCNDKGMKFGIWLEPEMVSPKSELYKAHPDWVFSFKTRDREEMRSQLTLNLAKPDVKEFIINTIDKLLAENNIEFIKWDSNRFLSQPGWEDVPIEEQRKYHYLYTKALYDIFAFINEKYPNVIVENCASGGMRADLSFSRYCSRINRSDNQDPRDAILLHEGFTYVNRSKSAGGGCHISRHGRGAGINGRTVPLSYMAHVGMLGSLAVGFDLRALSDEETEEIKGYIALHKKLRNTVQNGDMYRLVSPRKHNYAVYSFVSEDKSEVVTFCYGLNLSFAERVGNIRLKGLDDDAVYVSDDGETHTGRGLMNFGIPISLKGDFDSKIYHFKKNTQN